VSETRKATQDQELKTVIKAAFIQNRAVEHADLKRYWENKLISCGVGALGNSCKMGEV
jgi:hypothetical protein